MKFAETPISTQQTIYLKDRLMEILKTNREDILEWHVIEGPTSLDIPKNEKIVVVKKK